MTVYYEDSHDGDGEEQLVRKVVCWLWAKLKDDGREPCFIHTIPGVGYSFHDNGKHNQCAHDQYAHAPADHDPKIGTRLG